MKRGTSRDEGYTYIVVLILLAVVSLASALAIEVAATSARRADEAELLAIGKEFERAFASYYRQNGGGARYPRTLEELTRDPRAPGVKRHLRRVYVDPLTGKDWGLVPAPGGGIMGVFSTSPERPFMEDPGPRALMPAGLAASAPGFGNSYADWRFGYDPTAMVLLPATRPFTSPGR
jgi:type II secretory pathway pseudopilin PulG